MLSPSFHYHAMPAFCIRPVGKAEVHARGPQPQAGYSITWMLQGNGTHHINYNDYPIHGNSLLLAAPGQLHLLDADADAQGYKITFTESFISGDNDTLDGFYDAGLFHLFSHCPVLRPDAATTAELQHILHRITQESLIQQSLQTEIISRYLKIFLIHIIRLCELSQPAAPIPVQNGLVKRFLALVEKNFREKKQVIEYAAHLSVTPNHLNEMVKKVSGYAASHHIRQRIIREAKRMATHSEANMKEIAYYLGFESSSHFSRFFKNLTGTNFSDFKKATQYEGAYRI